MSTEEWQLRRVADNTTEPGLFDIEVVDAVNRFGRHGIAFIDDENGRAWDNYSRGTPVEFEYSTDGGGNYTRRQAGYIAEKRERENDGADELELNILSYDHLLRRQTTTRDLSGQNITQGIETIVQNDTPVGFSRDNVTIVNEQTLTRAYDGETPDNAIAELLSKSANEEFGVDDNVEFFVRPRENTSAPRGVDNTQWFDHDIPEADESDLNEVTVFYGDVGNESSVTVRDGADQENLEDTVGTPGPVVFSDETTRRDITNETDARDKANEILSDRSPTLAGTVTTYGLFEAEPGDILPLEIVPRDIDSDFRIAELKYRWDETVVSIVEKERGQTDTLVQMTDTLKRVEQRAANRSAPTAIYEGPLKSAETLTITATLTTRSYGTDRFTPGLGRDSLGLGRSAIGLQIENVTIVGDTTTRATNTLRDAIRNGWTGDSPPTIDTVAIGNGTATPSRTDTALDSQVFNESATVSTTATANVSFAASGRTPQSLTVRELGLTTAGGDLHTRLNITETAVEYDVPTDYQITINASDDADADGVVTDSGSQVTRDIIADDNPDPPTALVFGRDDTAPDTADTSLTDKWQSEPIDQWQDRQTAVVDATANATNNDGSAVTLEEWGLESGTDLKTHITIANLTLQDSDTLNARQRLTWSNS